MLRICYFMIIVISIISCRNDPIETEEIEACGFSNPKEELVWLKDLIAKADTDKTGKYLGSIYLEENDLFWVRMSLGTGGGALGFWFDCEGTILDIGFDSIAPKRDVLIYSNVQ